jgi:hypothetical protein
MSYAGANVKYVFDVLADRIRQYFDEHATRPPRPVLVPIPA